MPSSNLICLLLCLGTVLAPFTTLTAEEPPFDPSRLEVTTLVTQLKQPMELAVAPDGRIFYIEIQGQLKVYDPHKRQTDLVGEVVVTTAQENGLIGLALDPSFEDNHWIYLQYSPPEFSGQHVSRFTLVDGKLDMSSEKVLLKYEEQRLQCCHHAGSLEFGPDGCLFIGTGDNTHPHGDSHGYAPIDERADKFPWDAQKSSSNTRSYNGKVLRIRPLADGTYEVPDGNLFPKDGSQGHPEIYVMGCRNPWRINVDQKTGYLYWGEVGPDAGGDGPRGPRGYDEINQAKKAGNFGWPYFIADNQAYHDVDFATEKIGAKFDPAHPVNESPNNTGIRELPPATEAFIYYPGAAFEKFPEVGSGGRTACAGPSYDFDAANPSTTKFPPHFNRCLFVYEWSRHWILAVHLTGDSEIASLEPFMPDHKFTRPVDMQFGPDGALYMLEYGETWGVNDDAKLVRIDYVRGNRPPSAVASAENNTGKQPLAVRLFSNGTKDKDGDDLKYAWYAHRAGEEKPTPQLLSNDANPEITFEEAGVFNVELKVTDPQGAEAIASVPVIVGNARPQVSFVSPRDGDFFDSLAAIHYQLKVNDVEDGTSDFEEADETGAPEIDLEAPRRTAVNMTLGTGSIPRGPGGDVSDNDPVGLRLMKKSDCFNCHAVDGLRVGPPFLKVAEKYRGNAEALEASVKRVREGSAGVWGKVPMLPHSQHSIEEIRDMVAWVYSLEKDNAVRVFDGFVGNIELTDAEVEKAGYVQLEASYRDLGAGEIPPLVGTAKLFLRQRKIEAEAADEINGPRTLGGHTASDGKFLGAINHNHFARFNQIPLDRVGSLTLRVTSAGSGGRIEARLDSLDGPVIASALVEVNGSWDAFHDVTCPMEPQAGRHDIYLVFINPERQGGLMNLDSVTFAPSK
ncbi:Soluble aldose sugar dehydrogenase YliI precursor [Bremerella volcania]|uniref:Soluble aldose sugar dehydrogenase YliI n=1 Tax=Bremerella volcania TaxID=2527984 RepID=A0A518CFG7_9BACT|nr:PQQ-dependent sugar dehydrogenase [Bremerella volcania]QDU77965.1 Soluble aldose sugar dehydrogenase YliI precursor [Bremerella volcania]